MFPNFDQPDLKASWKLEVVCPKEWEVVSNERPNREEEIKDVNQFNTYSEILNQLSE